MNLVKICLKGFGSLVGSLLGFKEGIRDTFLTTLARNITTLQYRTEFSILVIFVGVDWWPWDGIPAKGKFSTLEKLPLAKKNFNFNSHF
jgi:hypothetical protein